MCVCVCVTIVPLFRLPPTEQVGVYHTVRALCMCVLHQHVLVLHIGIQALQLAQLQEMCGKQGKSLEDI